MGEFVKWALLAAGIVALIALIIVLPVANFLNVQELSSAINSVVNVAADFFQSARGLINSFTTPFGATIITGLIAWFFGKFFITLAIKLAAWVYHFIFK